MAITPSAAGTWAASNATTQTVTLPTHAAGDMLILVAACKAATIPTTITITTATDWTSFSNFNDGVLASGNGTGSVQQRLFYKIATSSSETNPVVDWGATSTPGIAVALTFQKAAAETWDIPVAVTKATNNATSISVTMDSNPGITNKDVGLVIHTTRDDSALTVPTWTATGATLSVVTEFPAAAIATITSNDMAGDIAYRTVTAGTASAAPVLTGTQAAAETGVTAFVRLRIGGRGSGQAQAHIKAVDINNFGQAQARVKRIDTYSQAIVATAGLQSYWRLDEEGGLVAFDNFSNNSATYTSATLGVSGIRETDKAVEFAAVGGINAGDILNMGSTGTWEMWVRRDVDSVQQYLMSKGTDQPNIGLSTSDEIFVNDNSITLVASGGGAPVTAGTGWHHIVFVHASDGVAADNRLYLDGVDVSGSQSANTMAGNSSDLRFAQQYLGADPIDGGVDEIAIYNVALSPTTILAHYHLGVGRAFNPAQAQATIAAVGPATVRGHAQAQARIKNTYWGHGQAKAYINPLVDSYGSATGTSDIFVNLDVDVQIDDIIVVGAVYEGTNGPITVTDDNGHTYIRTGSVNVSATDLNSDIMWARSQINGTVLISGTFPSNDTYALTINVFRAGAGQTYFISSGLGTTGTSNSPSTGSITATGTNSINYGVLGHRSSIATAGAGYKNIISTNLPSVSDNYIFDEYKGYIDTSEAVTAGLNVSALWVISGINLFKVTKRNGFGQAQAQIVSGAKVHGQAQGRIKATDRGHAQAQSNIKATSRSFAQSQANIETTYPQHAQAQAIIKNTFFGLGQAQALIYISQIARPISDVSVTGWIRTVV
jgi:hypothetical protein